MDTPTLDLHKKIISSCKTMFKNKMSDYGTSWFVMRLASITDQIMIKIARVRTIQISGKQLVEDDIKEDFIGAINYSIMALIRAEENDQDLDLSEKETFDKYDKIISSIEQLCESKNHDYGEAWKKMRLSSLVDIIMMKLIRIKKLEDNKARFSEGVTAGYKDIVNYCVFCLLKLG
jgi:hypothetical protein